MAFLFEYDMAKIDFKILKIEHAIENREMPETYPRQYLGMSTLGDPCGRALWYSFRWAYKEQVSPRVQRIFDRGDLEEDRIIADLMIAGCDISGRQDVYKCGEHLKGHCDGKIDNLPDIPNEQVLLEMKTMKASSFADAKKKNDLKKSNYKYYCQMVVYMYMDDLNFGLMVITNKDTEERHYEIVKADPDLALDLLNKGVDIINSTIPPAKLNESPTWFECKFCRAKEVCHYGKEPERNCRTCEHVSVTDEGWYCSKNDYHLGLEQQEAACDDYTKTSALST